MSKKHSFIYKSSEGFTLIELMIVIVIIAILSAVSVGAYLGYVEKAKEAADCETLSAVLTAAQATLADVGEIDTISVETESDDSGTVESITAKIGKSSYIVYDINGTSDYTSEFTSYYGDSSIKLTSTDGKSGGAYYSGDDSEWTFGTANASVTSGNS